jgi:hypothetical protein
VSILIFQVLDDETVRVAGSVYGERMKRISSNVAAGLVVAVMGFAAFSLWTIVPFGWIWIGSKISKTQDPSAGPYALVFVGIVISILVIAWVLSRLNRLYARLTGGVEIGRLRPAWLKSMRDSSAQGPRTTVLEAIVVSSVVMAALAGLVWFLVLAGSPLPNQ